jgi:predicted ATPase
MSSSTMKLDCSKIRFRGRQNELDRLDQCCRLDDDNHNNAAVFIEGPSGTGKSFLVDEFLSRNCNSIFHGKGKFDDQQISTFSAIQDAVYQLCENVAAATTESNNILEGEAVQSELGILSSTFPCLKQFIVRDEALFPSVVVAEVSTTTEDQQRSYERLKFSLKSFFREVSSRPSSLPVVLFLDDIQWATQQDLGLLQALVNDPSLQTRQFLLIASHRPVAGDHPLATTLKDSLSKEVSTNITLENLTVDEILEILMSLLHREEEDTRDLATVIHRKTGGNLFFAIQLIRLIEQRGLFTYSMSKFRWEWDPVQISAQMQVSDNVVDVVASKLRELSEIEQEVLVTASFLGKSLFQTDALRAAMASEPTEDDFARAVRSAVENGFLEDVEAGQSLKFCHDRIQEGSYSLIPESQKAELHVAIGRRLWKLQREKKHAFRDDVDADRLLLQIAHQLNIGRELITSEDEKLGMAELNHKAGWIAMQRSCFFVAVDFLRTGRCLLGPDSWKEHYALTTKLSTLLCRAEFCCGRIEETILLCDEVLANVHSVDDKQGIYLTKMHCLISQQGKLKGTIQIGYVACRELGHPFPMNFLYLHLPLEVRKIKKVLKGLSEEQLKNLPDTNDERVNAALEMYQTTGELAINGAPPNEMLGNMMMLRAIYVTLKYGRSPMTASCFMAWAWALHEFGELEEAYRFGEIGLHYANQRRGGREDSRAKMIYCMVIGHIKRSYHDLIDVASAALKDMWTRGAVAYVLWDTFGYLRLYYSAGLPLKPLSLEIKTYVALLLDYDNRTYYNNQVPYFQLVANLMGESRGDPTILSGEYMEQSEFIAKRSRDKNNMSLQAYYFARLMAAYHFNDLTLAAEMVRKMGPNEFEGPETFVPLRYFFQAMTAFGLYKRSRSRIDLRRGSSIIQHFQKWINRGVMVCTLHLLLILQAEKDATCSKTSTEVVQKRFDDAIASMSKLGILHYQALANERAGVYFLRVDREWARVYLTRARELYLEWGAVAKVEEMDVTYAGALSGSSSGMTNSSGWKGGNLKGRERLVGLSKEDLKGLKL